MGYGRLSKQTRKWISQFQLLGQEEQLINLVFQMWQYGNSSDIKMLLRVALDPYRLFRAHCDRLLGDGNLIRFINCMEIPYPKYQNIVLWNSHNFFFRWLVGQKFDVALVDLVVNECGLALTYHLGVPVVGYWAFALSRQVKARKDF